MDALEAAVGAGVERARQGHGPTLVEAKTYRYAGHSRSDRATYRPAGELEEWRERDPITLFGRRLTDEGIADATQLQAVWDEARLLLEQSLATVLESPRPAASDILSNITATSSRWREGG